MRCVYVCMYVYMYIYTYIYIVTQWSGFCKVHIPTHQDANVWSRDKRVASCFSTINLLYEIDMAICTYKAIESSELTYLSLGFMLNLFGPYSTALGCKRTVLMRFLFLVGQRSTLEVSSAWEPYPYSSTMIKKHVKSNHEPIHY